MAKKPNDMEVVGPKAARANDIRDIIQEEVEKIESGYVGLAQALFETVEQGYFVRWGFSSFEEYCTEELKIGYRRANYLVQIAQVVKQLGIEWEDIQHIGWTKMRAILPALKQDQEVGDWIDLASELSVKDLEKLVKDHKIGLDVDGDSTAALVTVRFRVTKEQYEIIADALQAAKEEIELDDDVAAIEEIAYQYFMNSGGDPERTSLPSMVKFLENKFKVKLAVDDAQDVNEIIAEPEEEQQVEV